MSINDQPRRERHEDQLTPTKTPYSNAILKGIPGTGMGDLDCELARDPDYGEVSVVTSSAWELDERHREMLAAGAHMRLSAWIHPIPPLALAIEAPFCGDCRVETIYVKSERAFACANCGERIRTGSYESRAGVPTLESEHEDERPTQRQALDRAHDDFTPGSDSEAASDT